MTNNAVNYPASADLGHSHHYLLPAILRILKRIPASHSKSPSLFELGCGNGAIANQLVLKAIMFGVLILLTRELLKQLFPFLICILKQALFMMIWPVNTVNFRLC